MRLLGGVGDVDVDGAGYMAMRSRSVDECETLRLCEVCPWYLQRCAGRNAICDARVCELGAAKVVVNSAQPWIGSGLGQFGGVVFVVSCWPSCRLCL